MTLYVSPNLLWRGKVRIGHASLSWSACLPLHPDRSTYKEQYHWTENHYAQIICSELISRLHTKKYTEDLLGKYLQNVCVSCQLSVPISRDIAILSLWYPVLRDYLKGGQQSPKIVGYPPLALSFTQAHLYDTPFCNISRDKSAIAQKTSTNNFAILSLQVSRDMKSIAAGPLRLPGCLGCRTSPAPKNRNCSKLFPQHLFWMSWTQESHSIDCFEIFV